jgi:hypothetical protein
MLPCVCVCVCLGVAFNYHIKKEHNMWSYLFFMQYLDETDEEAYNYLEYYVDKLVDKNSIRCVRGPICVCVCVCVCVCARG